MHDEAKGAPTSDYDEFVNWEKRLGVEGPFFRELFEREGVSRVVDVGAGSARHSILFASWGLEVIAVDPDDSMLAAARLNEERFATEIASGGGSLRIVEGGFGELHRRGLGSVDAVICTGNALPHVAGRDGLTEALADFASVLVPGGILVVHLLNHERLLASRQRVVPPKVVDTASGSTKVFVRLVDYPEGDEELDFDFVTIERDASGGWSLSSRRSVHTAITTQTLRSELRCAGFGRVEVFGGHDRHALTDADESVIVVAQR
ncbi:MAG: class I SAM-dependent methyltransferase [Coriobacteriia bacterium]|nr:class I SAM-dependent methyltransferase [Coriobacteriia bacterium]